MAVLRLLLISSLSLSPVRVLLGQPVSTLPQLTVSPDGRHLCQGNQAFVWLGDTAWYLDRLSAEETLDYLRKRAGQGFTLIQGPVVRNAAGELDSTRLDQIVDAADRLGLYLAVVPAWAQTMEQMDSVQLYQFGYRLGRRYQTRNHILWIAGGEAAGETKPGVVEALAAGLLAGHGGRHLMTVHPTGQASSSSGRYASAKFGQGTYRFGDAAWLAFNMIQSGHLKDYPTYQLVGQDYTLHPAKPTFESEYFYEDALQWEDRFKPNAYRSTPFDVRKGAYQSWLAGGFGYTYGHHAIWQMYRNGGKAVNGTPSVDWRTALDAPGARQLMYWKQMVRAMGESLIPNQSLLVDAPEWVRAASAGNRIVVYSPLVARILVHTTGLLAKWLRVWRYSPATGQRTRVVRRSRNTGQVSLVPNGNEPDDLYVVEGCPSVKP